MSMTALRAAFSHIATTKLRASSALVLLCLANRHNQETGRCDPSLTCIAADAGISDRLVRFALRELEEKKLITTVHRKQRTGRGKRNLTNRYRIKGAVKTASGGGEYISGGMGNIFPGKQEYTPSAFDALAMSISEVLDNDADGGDNV